jgi:hypothetical protein
MLTKRNRGTTQSSEGSMVGSRTASSITVTTFLSPPEATHRVGEVPVNCAWTLASNQYRVLIIDLDGRGAAGASLAHYRVPDPHPGHRGLPPWVSEWLTPAPGTPDLETSNLGTSNLGTPDPGAPGRGMRHDIRLAVHLLPDGRSRIDLLDPGVLDPGVLGATSDGVRGRILPDRLRAGLNASGYDHAFLTLPSRDGAVAEGLEGVGDRTVLVCEATTAQVQWADKCRESLADGTADPGLVLLGLPTRVGPEPDTLLSAARTIFGPTDDADHDDDPNPPEGAPFVLVPQAPTQLSGLGLVVPFEEPRAVDRTVDPAAPAAAVRARPVTQAYLALGRALSGHPLTAPPALSDGARRRYEQAAGHGQATPGPATPGPATPGQATPGPATPGQATPGPVIIVHRAQHSRIAAWIERGLAAEGCDVRRVCPSADLEVPSGTTVVTLPDVDLPQLPGADRINVRVSATPDDFDLALLESEPGPACSAEVIDLTRTDGADAWDFLRRRLGFADGHAPGAGLPPLGRPTPAGTRLPLPNPFFTGRQAALETVRDTLGPGGGTEQVWVIGPPGIGKSELAREYLHRFGADYAWVCWLPAESASSVHAGLHALAHDREIGLLGAVLSSLKDRLESWESPWLLVLDGVTDPEDLGGLLPQAGHGHILITAHDAPAGVRSLELSPFTRSEAVGLLGRLSRLQDEQELTGLAAVVGTHPLSVHLAGSWVAETARQMLRTGRTTHSEAARWAASELTLRLTSGAETAVGGVPAPPDQHHLVQLALDLLANMQTGAAVVRHLAMALTALNPSGADFALLSEIGLIEHLAAAAGVDGDRLLADSTELHLALRAGVRTGLLDLSWPTGVRLRSPDVTRETLIRRAGQPALAAAQRHVLNGLAATCPTDAGDHSTTLALRYTELGRHLLPSEALDSDQPRVRRWIVHQVGHWYRTGDLATHRWTLRQAEALFPKWKERFGAEDLLRLRLGTQLANLYRALGEDTRALKIDEEVLVHLRRALGSDHPRTWLTVRGKASDLLGLGRFPEALFEQQHAWAGFCDSYGEDHLETLTAAQELSLCLILNGQDREAAEREFDTLRRLARVTGRQDATMVRSAVQLSLVLRNLGQLAEARRQLARVREGTQDNERVGNRSRLRLRRAELVTARDEGNVTTALAEHREALKHYEDLLGPEHPEVVACRLSVAGHAHRAGDAQEAIQLAGSCLESLTRSRGREHPFVGVCHDQLGVFHRAAGEAREHAREAREHAREAREHARMACVGLADVLGDGHPWTLTALINQANLVFDEDRPEHAREVDREVFLACRRSLTRRHPLIIAAEHNLRLSGRSRGAAGSGARRADVLTEIP